MGFGGYGRGKSELFAVAEEIAVLPEAFHAQARICIIAGTAAHGAEGGLGHLHFHGQHGQTVGSGPRPAIRTGGKGRCLRSGLHCAKNAQGAQLVGVVFHLIRVPGVFPRLPGGQTLHIGRADVLIAAHRHPAHECRGPGADHNARQQLPFFPVQAVMRVRHCGQGVAPLLQPLGQGLHRRQHV